MSKDRAPSIDQRNNIPEEQLFVSRGPNEMNALGDLRTLRSRFVSTMGWFPEGHEDNDRYDELDETIHIAAKDMELDTVIAGLRLTQVDSIEKSLSWSMIERHDEMILAAKSHTDTQGRYTLDKLDEAAKQGNAWDLTRLVNPLDKSIDAGRMVGSIVELFAVGTAMTARREEQLDTVEELKWFFVTTPLLKQCLDRLGIEHEVVAAGRISVEDETDSYLCVTEPMNVMRSLYANQDKYGFTVKHVTNGFKKANAL